MTYDQFLDERLDTLLRFAVVLCGDRPLAEDVVHEVLLRAQHQWTRIGAADSPFAYVRRMVVNEHLAYHRKWGRQVPTADVVPAAQPDHADVVADRADLMDRLSALPGRQRAAVVLRYYNGLTDAEIADELGCSTGAVRSYISRGLAALRVQMSGDLVLARKDA